MRQRQQIKEELARAVASSDLGAGAQPLLALCCRTLLAVAELPATGGQVMDRRSCPQGLMVV